MSHGQSGSCGSPCFSACTRISETNLDRYTDIIDNVLSDGAGRKLFEDYLREADLEDSLKILKIWERAEKLLNKQDAVVVELYSSYIKEIDRLSRRVEREFDASVYIEFIEKCDAAKEKSESSEDIKDFKEALQFLKHEAKKCLSKVYKSFRKKLLREHK